MRLILTALVAFVLVADVDAGGKRRRYRYVEPAPASQPATFAKPYSGTDKECKDALAEVNACRAQRGLKPYVNDPLLAQSAYAVASFRAANLISGHVEGRRGDFGFLVNGAESNTAGCGALDVSWGWGACATFDNYTYCGAAWVMGRDSKRYMHAFYR